MKRPESKPRFFIFRDTNGKFKCRSWESWYTAEENIVEWADSYLDGCWIAEKMNKEAQAQRDPQKRLL